MSGVQAHRATASEDIAELQAMYRRLAGMDPPALRSLAGELRRISDESLASARLHGGPAAQARAGWDAERTAAAQAALASIDSEG
jgi:hypothetical protein